MKYKLINIETKAEFICEKIIIETYEYYVNDSLQVINSYYFDKEFNRILFVKDKKDILKNYQLIVATNRRKYGGLNIPQIISLSDMANEQFNEDSKTTSTEKSLWYDSQDIQYQSFINGYNRAKEQYPYSKEDMIEFIRFFMAKELTSDRIKNLAECLELFEKSRTKTIYFK